MAVVILFLYSIRVFALQGWYIVTYALAIYLLNLFIAFITPKFDPATEDDEELGVFEYLNNCLLFHNCFMKNAEGPSLPTQSTEEFKPFIRRLPEFKFW